MSVSRSHRRQASLFGVLCGALLLFPAAAFTAEPQGETVQIRSSHDQTQQSAIVFVPEKVEGPKPLLVLLHSWSADYRQKGQREICIHECNKRGWAFIHPDFRGPNVRPEACASPAAVQDVLDAVDYMKQRTTIDPQRIYLVGSSGGGHMSLMMSTRAPDMWAGVSAWVPISDLAAWHAESVARKTKYAKDMEHVCGGAPGTSAEVDAQYRARSPLFALARAKGRPIDISAGIHDGHTGSVPVSHSLYAFNALADANGKSEQKLTEAQIRHITDKRAIPEELSQPPIEEDRKYPVLFRREAGPARVTIFDGGHEGDMRAAIHWLAQQVNASR